MPKTLIAKTLIAHSFFWLWAISNLGTDEFHDFHEFMASHTRGGGFRGNRGRPHVYVHVYVHVYTVERTYVRVFALGCLCSGDVGSRDATGLIVTIDARPCRRDL